MTDTSTDEICSPSKLTTRYGITFGEAERMIARFDSSSKELDALLRAKNRTRRHRSRERNTPVERIAFGLD